MGSKIKLQDNLAAMFICAALHGVEEKCRRGLLAITLQVLIVCFSLILMYQVRDV